MVMTNPRREQMVGLRKNCSESETGSENNQPVGKESKL